MQNWKCREVCERQEDNGCSGCPISKASEELVLESENNMNDYIFIIGVPGKCGDGGNGGEDMSLAALRPVSREQVERMRGEWQVCFEDWRKQMAGDQCSKCGFQHYGASINHYHFCPACGAPMTDEAVRMVMERLEAVYGQASD